MLDIKVFLQRHAENRNELEDELRRFELLNGESYYRSPSDIDGMPHGSGGTTDSTANSAIRDISLVRKLESLKKLIDEEEAKIESILALLPKANQKTVIRIKYYQRYEWDDVALFMYGDKRDYAGNSDKYKTKAQKVHGAALANMRRIQQKSN